MLKVTILTIFPEMFPGPLGLSIAGRALQEKKWQLEVINIRDFGLTKHRNVDDLPCGGGNGMIMRPDVLGPVIEFAMKNNPNAAIYYPSPRGIQFNQTMAHEISAKKNIIILCGRFEGIDERVIDEYNLQQINIGDYILSGGEIAAYAILDSVLRLVPGVLANSETLKEESFEQQINDEQNHGTLLEHPLYTKPNVWKGREVPEILLSGNHQEIKKWKIEQSIKFTKKYRPDLLK